MISFNLLRTLVYLLTLGAAPVLWAEVLHVLPESKVTFSAVGKPGFIRISGEGSEIKGALTYKENSISGDLIFGINAISTGIDLRDNHLKEKYLEVAKYPEAKLTLTDLKIPTLEEKELKWTGKLSLHGKDKEVSGEADVSCKDFKPCEVKASFPIMLEDFAVEIPTYAGITVAKKVEVEAILKFKKDEVETPKDKP